MRGGITTRPLSSAAPASGGIECSAYIAGYSRRKIASVDDPSVSKMLRTRSSTGTSREAPRSAALFPAQSAKSGMSFIFSG